MTKYVPLLLFFINFAIAQNQGKAIYKIKYNVNLDTVFNDTDGLKKEKFKKTFYKSIENTEKQEFSLVFKDNESHFSIVDKMDSDSEVNESKFIKKLYPDHYFFYQNDKMFTVHNGFNKNGYLVDINKINLLKLNFKDETYNKIIKGLDCSLALYKSDKNTITKIWYTPNINKPFGPLTYVGLPGLVVKVETPNGIIIQLEKIKFINQKKISIPDDLEKITEDRFNEIVKQALGRFNNN